MLRLRPNVLVEPRYAGYDIDWTGISQAEMIRASIDAYNGNADSLARLIRQSIRC